MMKKFWNDEAGFATLEYLFGATIIAIGVTVGLVALKNSINSELSELGQAVTGLSQGYSFNGQAWGACASTDGSTVTDTAGDGPNVGAGSVSDASAIDDAACP